MLQTQEHCRREGGDREGGEEEKEERRKRREGRGEREEERGKEERGKEERWRMREAIKKGNLKWRDMSWSSSHDVHFAVLIVPAVGRKVIWFTKGHLSLGHFDELIGTSWSVCAGKGEGREVGWREGGGREGREVGWREGLIKLGQ